MLFSNAVCSEIFRREFRFAYQSVRAALAVQDLSGCELACLTAVEFTCRGFSYR